MLQVRKRWSFGTIQWGENESALPPSNPAYGIKKCTTRTQLLRVIEAGEKPQSEVKYNRIVQHEDKWRLHTNDYGTCRRDNLLAIIQQQGKLANNLARSFFKGLVIGRKNCHYNTVHGDIKCDNCLLGDPLNEQILDCIPQYSNRLQQFCVIYANPALEKLSWMEHWGHAQYQGVQLPVIWRNEHWKGGLEAAMVAHSH